MNFNEYVNKRLSILEQRELDGKLQDNLVLEQELFDLQNGKPLNTNTVMGYLSFCNGNPISYADFVCGISSRLGITTQEWHTVPESELMKEITLFGEQLRNTIF